MSVNKQLDKGLDELVRDFKGYILGENCFDELDFKEAIINKITQTERTVLEEIAKHNYCEELGTYDFDGIAEEVLRRIK